MTKELQVGDIIYQSHFGEIRKLGPIDRVTKTMAMVGGYKFRKNVSSNNYVYLAGESTFSIVSYRLEDDKLKEKYLRQRYLHYIKQYTHKLSIEYLEEIFNKLAIINEVGKHGETQ